MIKMLELALTLLFHLIKRNVAISYRYDAFTILYDVHLHAFLGRHGSFFFFY
jgi:7-keto-8-aminopelargonate synthetase-like enzyme